MAAQLVTPKKNKETVPPAVVKLPKVVKTDQPNQAVVYESDSSVPVAAHSQNNHGGKPSITLPEFQQHYSDSTFYTHEGLKYLSWLEKNIYKKPTENKINHYKVRIQDYASVIFYNRDYGHGVCVIFPKLFYSPDGEPQTNKLDSIIGEFKSKVKDLKASFKLVNTFVVIPEECTEDNAFHMAETIFAQLNDSNIAFFNEFNLKDWDGVTFQINTNQTEVKRYISLYSPHTVPERNDFGFSVLMNPAADTKDFYLLQLKFAVSGYTKFITPHDRNDMNAKIIPIPTITSIASFTPTARLIPLVIALATKVYLIDQMWMEPFKHFAEGQPNLGMLVDEVNRPVTTLAEFNQLLMQYFELPRLCLDITKGRYGLASQQDFCDERCAYDIIEQFSGRNEHLKESQERVQAIAKQYIHFQPKYNHYNGVVTDEHGVLHDTRAIDYLNLAAKPENDRTAIANFKLHPANPSTRINEICALYPNTRLLYDTTSIILAPQTIAYIASVIKNKITVNITTDYTSSASEYISSSNIATAPTSWGLSEFSLQ